MPFWPGTGIPYGMSPLALSGGAAEARINVAAGVPFASFSIAAGCSAGVGVASTTFKSVEAGRCVARFGLFRVGDGVGCGWNAFDIECPTFFIKSPTGSASTQVPLRKNSAVTGRQSQRERTRHLTELSSFNVGNQHFSRTSRRKKRKFYLHKSYVSPIDFRRRIFDTAYQNG
jgi:hypothetical protein